MLEGVQRLFTSGAARISVSIQCVLVLAEGLCCVDAVTARINSAWKSFRELLPLLTDRTISPRHRDDVFSACVRAVLLHASETSGL